MPSGGTARRRRKRANLHFIGFPLDSSKNASHAQETWARLPAGGFPSDLRILRPSHNTAAEDLTLRSKSAIVTMGKSPAEMTVAALKKELEARGLDTKGLKAVLVARLEEAMGGEATGDEAPAAEPAAAEEEPAEEPKPEVRIHPTRSLSRITQRTARSPPAPSDPRAKPTIPTADEPTINHPPILRRDLRNPSPRLPLKPSRSPRPRPPPSPRPRLRPPRLPRSPNPPRPPRSTLRR